MKTTQSQKDLLHQLLFKTNKNKLAFSKGVLLGKLSAFMCNSRQPTENKHSGIFGGSLSQNIVLRKILFIYLVIFIFYFIGSFHIYYGSCGLCSCRISEHGNKWVSASVSVSVSFLRFFSFYLFCPLQVWFCFILLCFISIPHFLMRDRKG